MASKKQMSTLLYIFPVSEVKDGTVPLIVANTFKYNRLHKL